MSGPLLTVTGKQGTIELYEDRMVIDREPDGLVNDGYVHVRRRGVDAESDVTELYALKAEIERRIEK